MQDARVYVAHTQYPRFFAEILPPDDEELNIFSPRSQLPNGDWFSYIYWIDIPIINLEEMIQSLEQALDHHWVIRDE